MTLRRTALVTALSIMLAGSFAALAVAVATRRQTHVPVAGAAYVTFPVHAGLEWNWEMPATTLAGLACAAALLGSARRS
jgi:hypothetical protein